MTSKEALKILKDSYHTKRDTELLSVIEDELKVWKMLEDKMEKEFIILCAYPAEPENNEPACYGFCDEDITEEEFEWLYKHIKDRKWVYLVDRR